MINETENLGDRFKRQYEESFPAFKQLFDMNRSDMLAILKDMLPEKYHDFINYGSVQKTTINDVPNNISIDYYDTIKIDVFGGCRHIHYGTITPIFNFSKHLTFKV